jgi:hypothetical protein
MTSLCAVCGEAGRSQDPLIPDEFYADVSTHLMCLNTPEGHRWRVERAAIDPAYARYLELIAVGRQVTCPNCGSNENYLSQKGTGHSPSFELCCTQCDKVSARINPYVESSLWGRLSDLQQDFMLGRELDRIGPAIDKLSQEYAGRIGATHCSCGGSLTIAAKPRCHRCRSILADTSFHYNDQRYPTHST